ncbi:hypothetical protein WMF28_35240 [Sorangium sp. So ce590]|uniref:hypothetical protein n=1 Tax=Sorangium sp. So ce590 TaxID=3133317 RepID=UPI003F5F1944
MSKMFRGFGSLAAAGVAFVAGLSGCTSQPAEDAALGSLSLPLAAEAQSGARYRLRNATFQIRSSYYWYDEGATVAVSVGAGGSGDGGGAVLTINSEDEDPDATSILVDLEQGSYHVRLLPGWNFEKVEGGTVSEVEATLLSSESIYVYVSPHSTTWAQYKFGIGDSALWLNGKLNVSIDVYEHPDEYYGNGGEGGEGGYGGYGGSGGGYGEGGYEAITSVGVGGYGSSGGAGGGSP